MIYRGQLNKCWHVEQSELTDLQTDQRQAATGRQVGDVLHVYFTLCMMHDLLLSLLSVSKEGSLDCTKGVNPLAWTR